MAIYNTAILTSNTPLASGSGERAITTIIVCNTTAGELPLTIYALGKDGTGTQSTAGADSTIINRLIVPAGDTVSFDQEKMVLTSTDSLVAVSSGAGAGAGLTATVSTLPV